VPAEFLTRVRFEGSGPTLGQIPQALGVGQILGAQDRNLLVGRAANLRRWFAGHLGQARPPRPGRRPATDLSPVAETLAYARASSPFQQRLLYERLLSRYVPLSARRDLKRPAYLHLDPEERFPRLAAQPAGGDGPLFGPFRDRRAAQRALEAMHKRIPLRPCDYRFEPDPALPLGLGCLYAQVRSCSAPCLARVSEDEYRALARQAAALLSDPELRDDESRAWLPNWVVASGNGVVAERGRGGLELYPVTNGAVLDESAWRGPLDELDRAVASLTWAAVAEPRDDRPWLTAWLYAPRKSGAYLPVFDEPRPALAAKIRAALSLAG
jgi:hypothetical protein